MRAYSTRFLIGRGSHVTQQYVVPAGMRAVVRFVLIQIFAAGSQFATVRVGAAPAVYWDTPGAFQNFTRDVRLVAYAGELVEIVHDNADATHHVSGFLFADDAARVADPPLVERDHIGTLPGPTP